MPVIKSAIKKLRRDRKKEKENKIFLRSLEKALKSALKTPNQKNISNAFSILDKSVKKNLVHKNKAARIKSKISNLLPKKTGNKKIEEGKKDKKISTHTNKGTLKKKNTTKKPLK